MEKKDNLKCPVCKKSIKETDVYCENCGIRLKEDNNFINKTINYLKTHDYIMFILIFIGLILFIKGISISIPSRTFSFYNLEEYVGGDAYNAIIESNFLSSERTSAYICKAIYTSIGLLIMCLGIKRIKK